MFSKCVLLYPFTNLHMHRYASFFRGCRVKNSLVDGYSVILLPIIYSTAKQVMYNLLPRTLVRNSYIFQNWPAFSENYLTSDPHINNPNLLRFAYTSEMAVKTVISPIWCRFLFLFDEYTLKELTGI